MIEIKIQVLPCTTLKVAIYAVIVSDILSYMYSIPKSAVFTHG